MERGFYLPADIATQEDILENGSSGRELAYASSSAAQGPITSTTDVTNCTITFTVGDRPVYVIGHADQIYNLTSNCNPILVIRDGANVVKSTAINTHSAVGVNAHYDTMERIATPGEYTRKLGIGRALGTGTVNINSSTDFRCSIRAIEA